MSEIITNAVNPANEGLTKLEIALRITNDMPKIIVGIRNQNGAEMERASTLMAEVVTLEAGGDTTASEPKRAELLTCLSGLLTLAADWLGNRTLEADFADLGVLPDLSNLRAILDAEMGAHAAQAETNIRAALSLLNTLFGSFTSEVAAPLVNAVATMKTAVDDASAVLAKV